MKTNIRHIALTAMLAPMVLLSGCGGGSGDSPLDAIISSAGAANMPAQPQSIPLQFFPTQQSGNVYSSRQEMFASLPLTAWSPYNWGSVYAVTIPNLQPSDVVQCVAQAEVTNNLHFNVQVDRVLAIGTTNQAWPAIINPVTSENVTPDMHHMAINMSVIDTGRSGTVTYSLVLSAASTNAQQGDAVTVERGYGGLWCHVMGG